MATTKTYTFANATTADATQVNKNFDDLLAGINADVEGPASSVAGHIATFADTTGKVVGDGGAIPTLATLGATVFNCGSYTGNAANNRAIAVGFQPKLVKVYACTTTGYNARIDATDGRGFFVTSNSVSLGYGVVAGLVLSATGFITGNTNTEPASCNLNTVVYKWEAWG